MTEAQKIVSLASGAKIRMVDATSPNMWVFYFMDGSNVCIHTNGEPLKASVMGTDNVLHNPFRPTMILRQIELWNKGQHVANIPTGEGGFIPWANMPGGSLDYETKCAIIAFAQHSEKKYGTNGPWYWNWKK